VRQFAFGMAVTALPGSVYFYIRGYHTISLCFALLALSGVILYAKPHSTETNGDSGE